MRRSARTTFEPFRPRAARRGRLVRCSLAPATAIALALLPGRAFG